MTTLTALPVINLESARFECTFGRGCEGICCRNGRPSVDADEAARIAAVLPRVLPLLRPEAKAVVEAEGVLSRRTKLGDPMLRVVGGWCVLFHKGCVLHTIGTEDGESYQYKPSQCALFPVQRNKKGEWYVRQWGVEGEVWDLFCLDPARSAVPAAESLAAELELARRFEEAG